MDDITCHLCGGTNFFKEAGHYYCSECQIQSQDVREHIFDAPEESAAAAVRQTSFKKIRTKKKAEDQLTSWECYNYVMLGLVNELIELGADPKLKQILHGLWFTYLSKLEVISDKPDALPKLSGVNSKKDAEIIYGRSAKRKRASRTPSPSSSGGDTPIMDSVVLRKEKAKKRRSMMLAEYDEFSTTLASEDVSLQNQSLLSLKSGGSDSSIHKKYLQFNHGAQKELKKIMSNNHLKNHCRDINSVLPCHKLSYKSFTSKYTLGPQILSRNKVYAILYLGLLICKDDIQLGDLLRFIREGKLSYHNVKHLFPEDVREKNLNIKSWNGSHTMLSHFGIRKAAAGIAVLLDVTKYVCRQNLVGLCQRYCTELNLPDEIMGFTLNLISHTLPRMQFSKTTKLVPNYEGRVMSMIMFTIKLYFGLDDITEDKFAALAERINKQEELVKEQKMFVWSDWVHHISYRKLILTQHHFPTQYLNDNENIDNPDLFVRFLKEQNAKHEVEINSTNVTVQILKQLLEKIHFPESDNEDLLSFPSSLTPFRDYINVLLSSKVPRKNNYLVDVLELNFKYASFEFLNNPIFYLKKLSPNETIELKHKGLNCLEIIDVPNAKVERANFRNASKREVFVKFNSKKSDRVRSKLSKNSLNEYLNVANVIKQRNTRGIVRSFEQHHMGSFVKNVKSLQKRARRENKCTEENSDPRITFDNSQDSDLMESNNMLGNNKKYVHHLSYERYWLKSIDVGNTTKEDFQRFITTFPESFQLLLHECARITEQHPKYLFEEFNDVEIHLCYVSKFNAAKQHKQKNIDKHLARFITKAKKMW